jgi:hypothetical protein
MSLRPAWALVFAAFVSGCTAGGAADGGRFQDGAVADAGADAGADSGVDAGAVDKALELALAADAQRYADDLAKTAVAREPGSANWKMVQDLCAARLESLGYTVERQAYPTGVNVIGVRRGSKPGALSVIVSAHYDHIQGCEGADDNASGVAGALEAARLLAAAQFENTLVVAFWDGEEGGLLGSEAYSDRAKSRGEPIRAAIVFEMIGYKSDEQGSQTPPPGISLMFPDQYEWLEKRRRRGDFIAFVGDDLAHGTLLGLKKYSETVGLQNVVIELDQSQKSNSLFHTLRRSDHDSFWKNDFPALFITDTSEYRNLNYHCKNGPDSTDRLNHAFALQVVKATVAAAAEELGIQ